MNDINCITTLYGAIVQTVDCDYSALQELNKNEGDVSWASVGQACGRGMVPDVQMVAIEDSLCAEVNVHSEGDIVRGGWGHVWSLKTDKHPYQTKWRKKILDTCEKYGLKISGYPRWLRFENSVD